MTSARQALKRLGAHLYECAACGQLVPQPFDESVRLYLHHSPFVGSRNVACDGVGYDGRGNRLRTWLVVTCSTRCDELRKEEIGRALPSAEVGVLELKVSFT